MEAIDTSTRIGELATRRVPVSSEQICEDIDHLFRVDSSLRSLLIDCQAGQVVLLNRGSFYEAMAGRHGYGWALHSKRSVRELIQLHGVEPPAPLLEAETVADVGLDLLASGQVNGADDLLVVFDGGEFGTVGVFHVLAWVGRSYSQHAWEVALSEDRLRELVQSGSDAIVVVDTASRIGYASPAYTALTGIDTELALGCGFLDVVHPEDHSNLEALFFGLAGQPDASGEQRFRLRDPSGSWRWCEMQARNLLHHPAVQGLVLNFRDVHDQLRLEADLRHQALSDSLTGLANRTLFVNRLDQAVEMESRPAVVFMDLDGFKSVNDSYGHQAGDELLVQVARRLQRVVRGGDTLARLGGDEFAILVNSAGGLDPMAVAQRIRDSLRHPFVVNGVEVPARASFGVATSTEDALSGSELLRRADVAMYLAKHGGRDGIRVWTATSDLNLSSRMDVVTDLAKAVQLDQLVIELQPYFDLVTHAVVGLEVLLRWGHPDRGRIPPGEFIPIAEQAGLMPMLGAWVLRRACTRAAELFCDRLLARDATVSVNVSATELAAPDFLSIATQALTEANLDPARLQLEITETALITDTEQALETLKGLSSLGVRLAVDDFGTGYASLSYLKNLPVDTLKIDGSFVANLGVSRRDSLIVSGIVHLAESLGIGAIAEGVERPEQVVELVQTGCRVGQGFYLSRPVAELELPGVLRAGIDWRR